MKYPKWLFAPPLLVLIVAMTTYKITSNGAPMGHTNAPGELTCNRSGCHVGNPLNSGGATLEVDLGLAQGYVPGMEYPVSVQITQNDRHRFGFQMLALADQDSTNAGSFIVTDSARTKIIDGLQQFTGRQYMTYKFPGTEPFAPGMGKWTFRWKAPQNATGPITFYTAAAVANNDGTDIGDYIYTNALTLEALPLSIAPASPKHPLAAIYPNPSQGGLQIDYLSKGGTETTFALQDPKSGHTILLAARKDAPGQQHLSLELPDWIPSGSYLFSVRQGTQFESHKLILAK